MDDFLPTAVTKKQRLLHAIIAGIIVTLVLSIVFAYVFSFMDRIFALFYILGGYLIGLTVKKFGKSFQKEFLIIASVLTFIFCILTEVLAIGLILQMSITDCFSELPFLFNLYLSTFNDFSKDTIMTVVFIFLAVSAAYSNASSV